jgi:hypothetical protein
MSDDYDRSAKPLRSLEVRYKEAIDRVVKLQDAIKKHRAQKADDRCIFDDDELYAVLGDGVKCDRRVGSKEDMLINCKRFIENRCEGGGWPTYAELEAKLKSVTDYMKQHVPHATHILKAMGVE